MIEPVLKLTPATARSATIPDDQCVYSADEGVSSVFADDVWDLSHAEAGSRSASITTIDFTYINHNKPAWRLAAKELAFHRLNTKLSPTVDKVQPYTCAREQVRLKRFIRWLETFRPDIDSPGQLTQAEVHAYRVWLERHDKVDELEGVSGGNTRRTGKVSPETVWSYLSPIKSFDLYNEYLTEALRFSPYNGRLCAAFVGVNTTKGINTTPPLADDVLHPLITISLRYVERYWQDIKAMAEERLDIWHQFEVDGWSKFQGWKTEIATCPDIGGPWREPLGGADCNVHNEFRHEMGNLISACASIALYLSGMRPREFCALEKDCLHGVKDPVTGSVVRWRIRGMPAKKKLRKRKLVEWVIPEPAAQAIKVLQEVLEPFRDRCRTDLLVLNLDAFHPKRAESDHGKPGLDERSLRKRLNAFLAVISRRYGYSIDNRIMPSQFRRTLARHIARQPYGIIAGKLQYHHVKTSVFEGYAGSEDDGFRLDVADEELLANIDLLEELRQDARDGCLLGPGASALVRDFDAAKGADLGAAMVDTSPNRLAVSAAVKTLAKRVHVGALNYCIWGTAKAACLTNTEAAARDAKPKINMCSPDSCGNSVLGACHVPRWQSLLDDVNSLASSARSGPQKQSLKQQADRYRRVLSSGVPHV